MTDIPTIDTSPGALRALADANTKVAHIWEAPGQLQNMGLVGLLIENAATLRALADEKERGASMATMPRAARVEEARAAVVQLGHAIAGAYYVDVSPNAWRRAGEVADAEYRADDLIAAVRAETQAERDALAAQLATAERRLAIATRFVRDAAGACGEVGR